MSTLTIILLIIACIIVLPFILAVFMRKDYTISRDIVINAPKQKVFDYVKLLKNQDYYNKWVMVDPNMKKDFRGTDGTVGAVYVWNGNKQAGEGELEITALEEGKKMDSEIRFKRPFVSVAYVTMTTESVSDNQTKVTWSNKGTMNYPLNFMMGMVQKMLSRDMDTSLGYLKTILEK